MNKITILLPSALLLSLAACSSSNSKDPVTTADDASTASAGTYSADVWADNWFAMYVGDTLVMEDSVSITTERSFNKESFSFEAELPFRLNVIIKDFKENDTGLEYIGEGNQQMGDGGFIAQVRDSNNDIISVSNSEWQCTVIHTAPLDKSCEQSANPTVDCEFESLEEPADWKSETYDRSSWVAATEFSEAAVSPKDGYDEVTWDSSATLIWASDLEIHNTLLCSVLVQKR